MKKNFFILIFVSFLLPQFAQADFQDVPLDHPSYEAVSALQKRGIIQGNGNGMFRPDEPITRAAWFKMAFLNVGYKPPQDVQSSFVDVPDGSWFSPFAERALAWNFVEFKPESPLFLPDHSVMKIDALKIMFSLEGISTPYLETSSPSFFRDIPVNFPFLSIVQAAEKIQFLQPEDGVFFRPYKILTRGEAAEIINRAYEYRLSSLNTEDIDPELLGNPKFPIFLDAWNQINQHYLDPKAVDQNILLYGALDGMVKTLKDPYSSFKTPKEAAEFENFLEGSFEGVGVVLDIFQNEPVVIEVAKDSPAFSAGIVKGDIIKKINKTSTQGLKIDDIIRLIRGPADTGIELEIQRQDHMFTFHLLRQKITLESVSLTRHIIPLPKGIIYISISQFTDMTGSEFENSLKQVLASKPKGIILDLRNNPGGYLEEAYRVLNHFIPKGKIMAQVNVRDKLTPAISAGEGELSKYSIVVLVNKNSASAAEITAGALQDHKIAKLVGEQTFGKGTVQAITTYSDGSFFKLSIAKWLTPLQRDINKIGLAPDVIVKAAQDDILGTTDSQLQKAVELLQSQI